MESHEERTHDGPTAGSNLPGDDAVIDTEHRELGPGHHRRLSLR
jgi:hypothetical protein